ncbi:hypothetical protein RUM43_012819 [Polyplax serrata]|uniref:Dedicator of cytokinesis protein 1 n=1 Tax=Polyplax serrata TaxID=468196 RepID=A0AAN8S7A5_POLSC
MKWQSTREEERFGVAVHNYLEKKENHLNLYVGDTVNIYKELGDWYLGCATKDKGSRGIFPKNYIKIKNQKEKQQPIIQEITTVVREWGTILKDLYIKNSKKVKDVERRIYELVRFRSEILSGALPVDEMKEMKRKVAARIDFGNHILGLDMVVRDDECNILNPDTTSTINLFWKHQKATENIKRAEFEETHRRSKPPVASNQYSHILFLCVRNFVCKINEDAELLLSLSDGAVPFTENYVVRWSKEGFVRDINQLHSLRVLFTDLGSRDLEKEKVYLVCHVIRLGAMEYKETDRDNLRKSSHLVNKKSYNLSSDCMRRPFGVAAMDITLYLSGKIEGSEDTDNFIPFFPCEKESLEQTFKRALYNKDVTQKDHKGQGLWVSLKVLHGDLKQVTEENPHLVLGNVAIARKMGFPEVILPGDVRNDLYLTLVSGDFTKGVKNTDKNIQVTVTVCNEKGQMIPGVIYMGGGVEALNEFKSVIYYHEDKPKWNEIFKVAVPIEEFKSSHIKFMFKHRSSNEAKDKSEKYFAMSFLKLMQENGTTVPDTRHTLCVYKIDHKKFDESDIGYLSLPWSRPDEKMDKNPCPGLNFSSKDFFVISTNVCSTKLTQNVELLGLLNWSCNPDALKHSLTAFRNVSGGEVMKYLQDVLDALFNILMQNSDSDLYDDLVFKCILHIIRLVNERQYQHFGPVLDVYIQESFCATLAYNKLIVVLRSYIECATIKETDKDFYLNIMKSLEYLFRFIVRSRVLFSDLNGGRGQEEFETQLKSLLNAIVRLMSQEVSNQDPALLVLIQGACLKHLPSTIPDVIKVFRANDLSLILADLIQKIPTQKLANQKLMTVNEIVKGPLFLIPTARGLLLPAITSLIKKLLESNDEGRASATYRQQTKSAEKLSRVLGDSGPKLMRAPIHPRDSEIDLCVKVLSDIMELLFRNDVGPTIHDITEMMLTVLRTAIQTSIAMDRENSSVAPLVVITLAIFRQMTAHHFEVYVTHFQTIYDRLDFLMEILLVFNDLVSRPVFPKDWCEMLMLQNSVILKSLRFFSHTIRDYFFNPFEHQAWNNFFHCAISFLTQPALQLETFSANKRARVVSRYNDMRRETGFEIRSMWFNLGQYKVQFVPGLVGAILEMTLVPESELRRATIPIFFDMMQCEFYSSKNSCDMSFTKRDSTSIKGNFSEFENEMIFKLDILFEGNCGDEEYKNLFKSIMLSLCEQHSSFKTQGVKFVKTVSRLMERLLEYRSIITDENKENRMSCTVNLLDFYSEINRKEMYIRYVNKLCELHLECDNYTEAAFTLKLHSALLNWTEETLSPHLKSHKHPLCQTHLELKEALYNDSIKYFDKGKMWECALSLCNELKEQYEDYLFDYRQLSLLHTTIARFYNCIMNQIRPDPEYFRVGFYGRGFPVHLQNKVFIYRGKEYERLTDFSTRMMNHLPNAELMTRLEPPDVQINKVDPVMDDRKQKFVGKRVPDQILKYHRVNEVQKFQFSRPIYPNGNEKDNEFGNLWLERTVMMTNYPLPGILMCFPVTSSNTFRMSPIETAIETMKSSNNSLRELIISYDADHSLPLHPLSMKLHGIVDAAVMGGIANYEKAFFAPEYEASHPEDTTLIAALKKSIAEQIPLLKLGIKIHKQRAPASLVPFHSRLEECYADMETHVESKYGKQECDLRLDLLNSPARRQSSLPLHNSFHVDSRNSTASLAPSDTSVGSSPLKTLIHIKTPSLPTATLRTKEKIKEKRKSKNSTKELNHTGQEYSNSQWYTGPEISVVQSPGSVTPVFELRQELTPKRPLRSEVEKEKRLSRPTSGQFSVGKFTQALSITSRLSQASLQSSNRDSTGTTESTTSEEDQIPPPLPVKQREADYCNLPDSYDRVKSASVPSTPLVWNKSVHLGFERSNSGTDTICQSSATTPTNSDPRDGNV